MTTTHDRIKALSHRVYVDAIPLGEFIEALEEFAEAERAELVDAAQATLGALYANQHNPAFFGSADCCNLWEQVSAAIRNAHAKTGATR